jgi:heavy metal sensor kinase
MFWKKRNRAHFFKSIRVRLVLGYTVILLAGITAVSIYFSFQMKSRLIEVTKLYLTSEIEGAIDLLKDEESDELVISDFLSKHTRSIKGPHKIGYALFNGKGLIVASSEDFLEDKNSVENLIDSYDKEGAFAERESTIRNTDRTIVYLVTRPFKDKTGDIYYLQFGVTPFGHQEAVNVFMRTGLLMIPVILLIGLVSGFILTGQFLSPISRLIKASNEIMLSDSASAKDLPVRGVGDELDSLAASFNNVLKKLRESYQKIILFTANASHEIRLPITAIKGEAEVVLERGRDVEEYRSVMESVILEMDRLTRMINRLLYLSRGDSGMDKLDIKKVELWGLLSKMVEFYRVLAERKNIVLELSTKKESFFVQADHSKLEELFSNIIENAIRYTPENGSITIEIAKQKDKHVISISDTGIGIPKEEQEKIFERFYRVDKARSREDGGAGLGLSIAAMIVKMHKGEIEVNSQPNKGSVFSISLPHE